MTISSSKTETLFASGHKTGDLKLWSLSNNKVLHTISKVHSSRIIDIKFHPENNTLISASADHHIAVTDLRTLETLAVLSD